jgi:hypothetical protein
MGHAEAMLGAAHHLAGNHPVAQRHFEAGLRHSASGSGLRAGHHLFHHTTLLLAGIARSLLYRGVRPIIALRTARNRGRKIRPSSDIVPIPDFVVVPVHERARKILDRLQADMKPIG